MQDSPDIRDLRKKFIIDESAYLAEQLKGDLEQLTTFCRITEKGAVLITASKLSDKKKVGLVAIARLIGHSLHHEIQEIVSVDEIASYAKIGKAIVNARAKELADEGFVSRVEHGKYKAEPGRIQDFLTMLKGEKGKS